VVSDYTPEQKTIAKLYETQAVENINNPEKFDQIMVEFDEIKRAWDG